MGFQKHKLKKKTLSTEMDKIRVLFGVFRTVTCFVNNFQPRIDVIKQKKLSPGKTEQKYIYKKRRMFRTLFRLVRPKQKVSSV
jgi:hypothetical protein